MLPLKWENLSRCSTKLVHFCKKLPLHWLADRANIIWKYMITYMFFHFWRGICGFFAMLFLKAPASCCKKKLKQFLLQFLLLFEWAQKVCLRFLKSYFDLEILIFLSFMVSFLVDMFDLKAPSLIKKHQWWNLKHTLVEKLWKISVEKY